MLLFTMMSCIMASCTTEMEDYLNLPNEDNAELMKLSRTCSFEDDSLDLGELLCLKRTEELLSLNGLCNENRLLGSNTRAANVEPINLSTSDGFFSSNIYAIRELPITIKVRSVASGSTASNCYISCNGAGKEVVLSNSSTAAQSKFYIKVMPPTSGISYLIYSGVSNTPICVGYYTKAPDNKILMSAPNNQMTSFDVAWNLLPSSSNKGYFAIQSETFIRETDSNGVSTIVVGYILEAMANNKIGYSRSYDNKAQQEFLITTDNSFVLQNIEYDLENATITSGSMVSKETAITNTLESPCRKTANVTLTTNETSSYCEAQGKLALNITAPTILKFPRPIPVAGQAVLMEEIPSDASYVKTPQNISKTINYTTDIELKPKSLLKLVTKFYTFKMTVPYVATATYKGREVKVRGNWNGYAIANPDYYAPINELHFYNLETGEEYK